MSEITVRRVGELVRGVFSILNPEPEGLPAREVFARLAEMVPPTPFENSMYPNRPSVRRYEWIVRFKTITLVKAGWMVKDKGQWFLTDEGREAYQRIADPEEFARESRRLYRQWAQNRSRPEERIDPEEQTATASTTLEEAEEAAWAEIEAHFSAISPYDFQKLVAGLLRGMGYHVAWVSPPGPDKGVDILAYGDPLGISQPCIKVQVKRRSERVSVDGLRAFLAVLGHGDVGVFVSSGGFTKDAENEARHQTQRRIMLVDLKRLFDLWLEHYERIPSEARRLLLLRPVYFLDPAE